MACSSAWWELTLTLTLTLNPNPKPKPKPKPKPNPNVDGRVAHHDVIVRERVEEHERLRVADAAPAGPDHLEALDRRGARVVTEDLRGAGPHA